MQSDGLAALPQNVSSSHDQPAAMQSDALPALPQTATNSSLNQPAAMQFIAACAKAVESCPKGQSAIYCGGQALLQDGDCLACLGKIAAATGAKLLCENALARIDRGAGLPHFQVMNTV